MAIKKRPKTGGRKLNPILQAYTERYNFTRKQREIASKYLVQLALCQSEEARRLLLGCCSEEA
jgi:hypothetical protein